MRLSADGNPTSIGNFYGVRKRRRAALAAALQDTLARCWLTFDLAGRLGGTIRQDAKTFFLNREIPEIREKSDGMRLESGSGDSVFGSAKCWVKFQPHRASESGVALRLPPHSKTPQAGDIYGSLKISVLTKTADRKCRYRRGGIRWRVLPE